VVRLHQRGGAPLLLVLGSPRGSPRGDIPPLKKPMANVTV